MKLNSRFFMKNIFILLLFYSFYATYIVSSLDIKVIDYLDEVIVVVGCIYITITNCDRFKIRKIGILLMVFIAIGLLGNMISGVNQNVALIGAFLSIKSYLIYLCFFEIKWCDYDIDKILNLSKGIYFLLVLFGYIFYFFPQFSVFESVNMTSFCESPTKFATLLVPLGLFLIISIVEQRKWSLIIPLIATLICIILAGTSKNIASLAVTAGIYLLKTKKKLKWGIIVSLIIFLAIFWNQIFINIMNDYYIYFLSETSLERPRTRLYIQAAKLATMYFPFGSGFGTYGSAMAFKNYSDIYYMFGFDTINGLNSTGGLYLMDTYWASILGETGWSGTGILLIILYRILKQSINSTRYYDNLRECILGYTVILSFCAICIESLFTSTLFSMNCYYVIGLIGIHNSILQRRKKVFELKLVESSG